MTDRRQKPGATCAAQRVWLSNDPLITDIKDRGDHMIGARTCARCGRERVTVSRRGGKESTARWQYAAHHVPPASTAHHRPAFNPKPRLAEEEFERALRECDSRAEMADLLGVSTRTIDRAFDRYRPGTREKSGLARTTPEHRRRIRQLASIGMPAAWIAEELPFSYETVLEHARKVDGYAEQVREWKRIWPSIRNNPSLFALHSEFTAKREVTIHGQRGAEDRDHPGVRRLAAAA